MTPVFRLFNKNNFTVNLNLQKGRIAVTIQPMFISFYKNDLSPSDINLLKDNQIVSTRVTEEEMRAEIPFLHKGSYKPNPFKFSMMDAPKSTVKAVEVLTAQDNTIEQGRPGIELKEVQVAIQTTPAPTINLVPIEIKAAPQITKVLRKVSPSGLK